MDVRVPGFRFASVAADVKGKGGSQPDLALILCDGEAAAAGMFTRNTMAAAPVHLCRERLAAGRARAVLVNSGNANCMTGERGMADARRLTAALGAALGIPASSVLMCSTGVIGQPLPVERMEAALPSLARGLAEDGFGGLARAIMTTDTRPKTASRPLGGGGGGVVAGAAKGAGMIAPDMATMLAFLVTDASVEPSDLSTVLGPAVDASFNRITVDGDTSTNDTVLLLASGRGPRLSGPGGLRALSEAVTAVCSSLAEQIVADGEGAQRVVEVQVSGAVTDEDARRAARAVAESLLVKTALAAADPNWGRIAGAVGYSGARAEPGTLSIAIGEVAVLVRGEVPAVYDEARAAAVMRRDRYAIVVSLGDGPGRASILTCDLTEEYVRINAEYRT